MVPAPENAPIRFRDVWASNLEEEFVTIREIYRKYPYIAMDTEFPGVVATPLGQFKSREDFNYQQVCCNVNVLKLIQVGFTFADSEGNINNQDNAVFQFHFRFCLHKDMYSQESVDMLKLAGIDFIRHQTDGIRMEDFGELLTTSGLVVNDDVTWLTFHSGYDFGYLIRAMLLRDLPQEESRFFKLHSTFFPKSYDIKMLMGHPTPIGANLRGGLQEVADQLQVERFGPQHQAGSDSLLTAMAFFKIKEVHLAERGRFVTGRFFSSDWDSVSPKVQGHLYGLGCPFSIFEQSASTTLSLDIDKKSQGILEESGGEHKGGLDETDGGSQ